LMRYFAKQEVKADLKAKGVPPQWVHARTIKLLVDVLLRERWAEFETKARQAAERIERSKKGRSSNRSTKRRTESNG
jgi:hypothetical protein